MGVLDRIKAMFAGGESASDGGTPAPAAEEGPPAATAESAATQPADAPAVSDTPAPAGDVDRQAEGDPPN